MKIRKFDLPLKRLVPLIISAGIATTLAPLSIQLARAADSIQTLATSYQPTLSERIDASGFRHPGIGFTKDILENMRTQVRAQKEPWNTYFNNMLFSGAASKTPAIKNVNASDPSKPRYYGISAQGIESLFIADAQTAFTQALLFYVTGDDTYRANAMRIIRLYEQMDPVQYAYYTDSHIHTGIPLSRMVGAAEILRYTSTQTPALAWTDDDTVNFTNNLVMPVVRTFNSCNCRFMNQHLYTTIAAMSGAIFAEDRELYNQSVEWFTVNKDAEDQGQNGAIKQLFRLVTKNDLTGEDVMPAVQHVEMGRDQAHGAGDITNAEILARMMLGQGTRVDPVTGTVSTEPNAVGPYEFLNDRILDAAELFGTFMSGYDIPWVPTASHTDSAGNPTVVYRFPSWNYRGRTGSNTWELYYYYQYVRGVNMEQRAPNFTKFFSKRTSYNWDSADGGGDFWLYIPKEAEQAEGGKYLVKPVTDPYREAEDRFTALDANSVAMKDSTASYVEVTATDAGSKLVIFGYGYGSSSYGIRVRTNGTASMDIYGTAYQLPDTKGQWRYVVILGGVNDFLPLTITGSGTKVDIDHLNIQASTALTPPAFTAGNADLTLYTYAGTTLTTSLDLSATDANTSAVVTYQAENLPQGASLNTSTGAFSWKPSVAGAYTFFVGASDGATVTMKRITIVVSADRQAAVDLVASAYNPATPYVTSSVPPYNSAYADIMSVIGSAGDDVFFQKLAAFRAAAAGLQQLTPLLSDDGSMNYAGLLYASDMGTDAKYFVDGNPGSSVNYNKAKNGALTMDFGPSFKVSANLFRLQAVQTFPERGGGIAIYGSNDSENWTRLTPGLSAVVDEMQELPVQDDLKNNRYRFLRIQVLEPASPLLQLGEFRIVGTRYETVNKISAISINSDQALRTHVIAGDTVKLSFVTTEPVNNVTATIQGMPATVATTDNLNWTATAAVNGATPAGTVKFLVNYKTAGGVDAEPTFLTTDASGLFVADQTNYISNLLAIATLTDSSGRNTTDALAAVNKLFDKNLGSATDYRVNGSGYGGWVEFDFRGGGTARLSRAEIIGNQDQYYTHVNGTVLQGSNDNVSWTTISNAAGATMNWQTLSITDPTPYRYIRVYNGNNWYGTMTELRLYGVTESTNQIAAASISSAQALRTRIVPGNTVKLTFTAKEAISNVSATIQGTAATVSTTDNINFTATATLPQGVAAGAVNFVVNYKTQAGKDGYPLTAVTDGTSLNLVDESDTIKNIGTIATLIDSTPNRAASTTLTYVNNLFDGNLGTGSDFRNSSGQGTGAYIEFDFKAGNQVNLTRVELAPSQDSFYTRIGGAVIQGSNDNSTWTNLTASAASTMDWQILKVSSLVPYRYLRIYNGNNWFGTMREVRFHGSAHAADTAAPATTDNAPAGWVNTDRTVTLTPADGGSGIQATYYKVDGGAQQTGKAILFNTEGNHSLVYWSVDWAGNTESQHSVSVKIDKTAPVTTVTTSPAAPASGWYNSDVTVNLAAADAGSGNATTYYTVDGGARQAGNAVTLSAKGTHNVVYWSVDQAGNTEQARTLALNIGPVDLTGSVQMTQLGATLNRATGKYVGGVTIANTSGAALSGPLNLKLNGLANGLVLDNASGTDAGGAPYIVLASPLAAGASVTMNLTFSNPNRALVTYTPQLLRGSL